MPAEIAVSVKGSTREGHAGREQGVRAAQARHIRKVGDRSSRPQASYTRSQAESVAVATAVLAAAVSAAAVSMLVTVISVVGNSGGAGDGVSGSAWQDDDHGSLTVLGNLVPVNIG